MKITIDPKSSEMNDFLELIKKLLAMWETFNKPDPVEPKPDPDPPGPGPDPDPPGPGPDPDPPHDQEDFNILEGAPFEGKTPEKNFWNKLDAFCAAGPTRLLITDMNKIPEHMTKAGFPGLDRAQWYALSRTYAGANWSPGEDERLIPLFNQKEEINSWWDGFVNAVIEILKKYTTTTAVVIVNDYEERGGKSLGQEMLKNIGTMDGRVVLGDVVPD